LGIVDFLIDFPLLDLFHFIFRFDSKEINYFVPKLTRRIYSAIIHVNGAYESTFRNGLGYVDYVILRHIHPRYI